MHAGGVSTPQGILVGYDGASDGDVALEWAVATSEHTHDPLRVVIVEDVSVNDGSGLWSDDYWDGVEERARATLRSLGVADPQVDRLQGRPLEALLDLAPQATLLVVGSRGHGRVGEMMLGSVSQHLAGHAACPVVVARPASRPDSARILVGMDGSGPASRALDVACRRAEKTGEEVAAVSGFRVSRDVPVDKRGNVPEKMSAHILERERDLSLLDRSGPGGPSGRHDHRGGRDPARRAGAGRRLRRRERGRGRHPRAQRADRADPRLDQPRGAPPGALLGDRRPFDLTPAPVRDDGAVPEQVHDIGKRRAWVIWLVSLSVYLLAVFNRSSLGVGGLLAQDQVSASRRPSCPSSSCSS